MKIAILYNSFDWCEQQIVNFLYKKGHTIYQEHVNTINDKSFKNFDLVLNRVMPSYAARDPYFSMIKFMNTLISISKEADLINSYEAACVDYSKYYAANLMEYYKIPSPKTYLLTEPIIDDIGRTIEKLNYPVIIKPTLSGRSRGVIKCINELELDAALDHVKADHTVIQEFTQSMEKVDYRVCVCNDEVVFTVTRSLIDGWLGCISKGSLMSHPNDVPEEVTSLAINVSKCARTAINGVDIIIGKDGPVVIENNPTPNFSPKYISLLGFNPIKRIMRTILNNKDVTPAEYLALIELLSKITSFNIKKVKIFGDAKLIIDQVNGDCKNNKFNLQKLAHRANVLLKQIPDWELTWVKRSENKRADALSKQ
jgi:glutathione synthase/RimK-type ligase-like ATP-grasp enzyme